MVEEVGRFGAELEMDPFVEGNCLEQAHVPVLEAGSVDSVTNTLSVERTGGGDRGLSGTSRYRGRNSRREHGRT